MKLLSITSEKDGFKTWIKHGRPCKYLMCSNLKEEYSYEIPTSTAKRYIKSGYWKPSKENPFHDRYKLCWEYSDDFYLRAYLVFKEIRLVRNQ